MIYAQAIGKRAKAERMTTNDQNAIEFILNGETIRLADFPARQTLLDWLRLDRRLTGTKEGCAEGDCGACTVLVGRLVGGALAYESVNACIRFMGSLHGTHVVTVEHLKGKDGALHPVQQALVDCHGSQCGFCTPGFVMSLYGLWLTHDTPSRPEIERALQGNLCRCTGYEPIVKAAEMAARIRPSDVFDPIVETRARITEALEDIQSRGAVTVRHGEDMIFIPSTPAELAEVLSAHPHATVVAGSTDVGLWVTKQFRTINPIVFINNLKALQTITEGPDGITIGAGVTYSYAFDVLGRHYPPLVDLVSRIGGQQVRNMGTIGGNIANGSPIGDMPPALIALGAKVRLTSREGSRDLPLEDYFIDYGKQDRQRHEFVESLFVPWMNAQATFAAYKISKRRDEDITAVLGAFHIRIADGMVAEARLAYGGMAGTPKRAIQAEEALTGGPWTEEAVRKAASMLSKEFSPLTDWRATAEYRMLTAQNLLIRFYLEHEGQPAMLRRFA